RLRAEVARQGRPTGFPPDAGPATVVAGEMARVLPPRAVAFVPGDFCYRPLYFEDRNAERYGWTVPLAQPALSTARFYLDTVLLPYKMVLHPPWGWECTSASPGPGDPVPFQRPL